MKTLTTHIDKETHAKFKIWCVNNGTTMRDVVTEAIREKIKKPAKGIMEKIEREEG